MELKKLVLQKTRNMILTILTIQRGNPGQIPSEALTYSSFQSLFHIFHHFHRLHHSRLWKLFRDNYQDRLSFDEKRMSYQQLRSIDHRMCGNALIHFHRNRAGLLALARRKYCMIHVQSRILNSFAEQVCNSWSYLPKSCFIKIVDFNFIWNLTFIIQMPLTTENPEFSHQCCSTRIWNSRLFAIFKW